MTLPSHSPRPLSRPCSWPCLAFRASLSGLPGPDPVASRLGSPGSAGPSRAAVPARRPFPVQEFRQEVTEVCCIESRSVTWSRAPRDGGRFLCLPGPPGLTSLCLHLEARPGPWRPPHPVATRSPGQAPPTPRPWGDGPRLPPGCDEQRPPAPPITTEAASGLAACLPLPESPGPPTCVAGPGPGLISRPRSWLPHLSDDFGPSPLLLRPSLQTPVCELPRAPPPISSPPPPQHECPWPARAPSPSRAPACAPACAPALSLVPGCLRASPPRQLFGKAGPEHPGRNPAPSPSSLFTMPMLPFPPQTRELRRGLPRGSLRCHWAVPHQPRAVKHTFQSLETTGRESTRSLPAIPLPLVPSLLSQNRGFVQLLQAIWTARGACGQLGIWSWTSELGAVGDGVGGKTSKVPGPRQQPKPAPKAEARS